MMAARQASPVVTSQGTNRVARDFSAPYINILQGGWGRI